MSEEFGPNFVTLTDDEGKAIDDAVAAGKSEECIYLL